MGRGLLGAVFQTLSTSVLIQLINIATGIITAHTLAPHGRGELAAVTMWPQFLSYSLTFGVPVSLLYCVRREPEKRAELLGAALLIGGISGLLSIIVGLLGIPLWLKDYPASLRTFAQFMMFSAPLSSIGILLTIAAQADQRFALFNKFRILPGLLTLALLAILYVYHHITVRYVAITYLVASLPTFLWSAVWVVRTGKPSLLNAVISFRLLVGYGIRAWGADLVGTIADQVDRVLVVAMLAPADMGLYVVALSSARVFGIIPGALSMALFPRLASLGPTHGANVLLPICMLVVILMSIIAFPMIIWAHFILTLVYGGNFATATGIFRVMTAEAIFSGAASMLAQGFSAFGKPGRSSLQQIAGLAFAVPLLFIFVPRFGLTGAGWAILCSTLARLFFAIGSYVVLFGFDLRMAAMSFMEWKSASKVSIDGPVSNPSVRLS